jgi:hypothetical protein
MDDIINTKEQSVLSKIRNIVNPTKKKQKLNKIDWQKRRLPDLARAVNSVFLYQKKKL